MPLDVFDKLRVINNAIHTYSSAHRDDYRRNRPRRVIDEQGMSEIVCQDNGEDCLYHVDKVYECFEEPRILAKGYVIQICKI